METLLQHQQQHHAHQKEDNQDSVSPRRKRFPSTPLTTVRNDSLTQYYNNCNKGCHQSSFSTPTINEDVCYLDKLFHGSERSNELLSTLNKKGNSISNKNNNRNKNESDGSGYTPLCSSPFLLSPSLLPPPLLKSYIVGDTVSSSKPTPYKTKDGNGNDSICFSHFLAKTTGCESECPAFVDRQVSDSSVTPEAFSVNVSDTRKPHVFTSMFTPTPTTPDLSTFLLSGSSRAPSPLLSTHLEFDGSEMDEELSMFTLNSLYNGNHHHQQYDGPFQHSASSSLSSHASSVLFGDDNISNISSSNNNNNTSDLFNDAVTIKQEEKEDENGDADNEDADILQLTSLLFDNGKRPHNVNDNNEHENDLFLCTKKSKTTPLQNSDEESRNTRVVKDEVEDKATGTKQLRSQRITTRKGPRKEATNTVKESLAGNCKDCNDGCNTKDETLPPYMKMKKRKTRVPRNDHRERPFVCTFEGCGKRYIKRSHLKCHMLSHSDERPYVCTHSGCRWAFARADELKRHMRSHTNVRPYACDLCDMRFRRSDHLNAHKKTHNKKTKNSKKRQRKTLKSK
eukprot:m.101073 g.101073  ORF g.101073 m.101073 type:complete len:567 (-) comp12566_c0_seq2:220-1920(-)